MEPQGKELRHRDGIQIGRVAAQAAGHDEPVEPSAHGKADGRPARRRDTGEICKARHTHQQPAGHIAGFGAHSRAHQIDHNGGNDADIDHLITPLFLPLNGNTS